MPVQILDILRPDAVKVPLDGTSKRAVIDELCDLLQCHDGVGCIDQLKQTVWEREDQRSTGIGEGLAIPHGKCKSVSQPAMAIGIPAEPLEFDSIDGKPVKLSDYRGKVLLIVNVASKCGFTPQYEGLEKLQKEFAGKGLVILGFPCNDFGGQEPGSAKDIKQFCSTRYNVTFPMFEKVSTKPGEKQSPIYQCLGTKTGKLPGWNFCKYLINEEGNLIGFFDARVKPLSDEITSLL